ncbi:MAG: hypothetical protein U9R58_02045 [Chloroflexota bacterium]|nr:hypothetical protein [Chloroflexota bacterium]
MDWKSALRSLEAAQPQRERAALLKQWELERQQNQIEQMDELERARYEVEIFENYVDVITSVHRDVGSFWDWKTFLSSEAPEEPKQTNAFEIDALSKLEKYKPGIKDRMFGRTQKKRHEFARAVDAGRKKDEENYNNALSQYEIDYADWGLSNELTEHAEGILAGEANTIADVVKTIDPFEEIINLGSNVDVRVVDSQMVDIVFQVNCEAVIPKKTKSLLESGKLSVRKMPKAKYYALYQDYVCGCILRIAREIFAILPINMAIITAMDDILDTKSGDIREKPILSVAIPGETLDSLNFETLVPIDSMDSFAHNMKFYKTKGFVLVEKLNPSDFK